MREREDVLRSARRYVASALGSPPWRVRLAMDGAFKRPFALVSTPVASNQRNAGPGSVRETLPLTVQLYPDMPDRGPMRATEARLLAERAAAALSFALTVGVTDATDATVRGFYHRIPLWDYHDEAGVPLPLEGPESVATRRFGPDYLWLEDGWTVHVQPEASDDELFVAIAQVRVQWLRSSEPSPSGQLLEDVQLVVPTGDPDVDLEL